MSFVVEIPSVFTKPTQIPVRLGNTILSGNETIQGALQVNGSLTLNVGSNVDNTNTVYYDSLDISNALSVGGNATIGEVPTSSTLSSSVVGGSLTLNTQPRFMAKHNTDETWSYVDTNLDINYNTIVYNIGGGTYNTTTGEYTIGVAGLYFFTFDFYTASSTYSIELQKNGELIKKAQSATSTGFVLINSTCFTNCVVGDVINIVLVGGKIRLLGDTTTEQGRHQFTGMKVA